MHIEIRTADESNKALLFEMNHHLMEDERYDRPPSEEDLKKRWIDFINLPRYGVYLFEENGDVVGYAIVHLDETPRYLRHFFISRSHRRKGLGTTCFNKLLEYLQTETIDLDVMSWNERGYDFWKSMGFTERCRVMAYDKSKK